MIERDDPEDGRRVATDGGPSGSAWERTLADMNAMAERRREDGWDVLAVPTAAVAPEPREAGESDRFGLTFVVPGNYADELAAAVREGEFPRYEVYHSESGGRVFVVVEYLDPGTDRAVFVAGAYELRQAADMVADAEASGEFFTHHRTLDGTHLGSFEHDSHEAFVPD